MEHKNENDVETGVIHYFKGNFVRPKESPISSRGLFEAPFTIHNRGPRA